MRKLKTYGTCASLNRAIYVSLNVWNEVEDITDGLRELEVSTEDSNSN